MKVNRGVFPRRNKAQLPLYPGGRAEGLFKLTLGEWLGPWSKIEENNLHNTKSNANMPCESLDEMFPDEMPGREAIFFLIFQCTHFLAKQAEDGGRMSRLQKRGGILDVDISR